jgi:putative flippase GtrA
MKKTIGQLIRYGAVGLASNFVGYFLYLGLTHLGVGPKIAMSLLYGVGVVQTFIFNKSWSFRFSGPKTPALARYVTLYTAGYIINFTAIAFFVDKLQKPHQTVMAILMILMALFFFAGQKYWVFPAAAAK